MRYGSGRDDDYDYPGHEPASGRRVNGAGRRASGSGRRAARPARGDGWSPASRRRGFWHLPGHTPLAKVGYALATASAVLIAAVGVTSYAYVKHLESNVKSLDVGGLSGKKVYGALNILVVGSQERQGQHGHFFGKEVNPWTSNSDNLLVVHLDPTHTHATVLSIPRDTMVYEPGCKARIRQIGIGIQGPYQYPPGSIIDGALNIGGPTCAVKTVEALTGIKLDHFIEFDFNSFRTMINAIGGVEVCVPKGGYYDQASNLHLSAGKHKVTYNQALAYVRNRHDLGGADAGGDLPRIEVQQAFISSMIQEINSNGILSSFPTLLRVANTATHAVKVDKGLASATELITLARSLIHLKAKHVTFLTMNTLPDPQTGYTTHLITEQPQDDILFQLLRTGKQWHGHLPILAPAKVQVRVLNATGQGGLAKRTARKLRALGFDVVSVGDSAYTSTTTVQFSGEVNAEAALTVMKALKSFPAGQNELAEPASQIGTPGPVTLVLGADFAGVNAPTVGATPSPSASGKAPKKTGGSSLAAANSGPTAVQSRNGGANICSGLPPPLHGK